MTLPSPQSTAVGHPDLLRSILNQEGRRLTSQRKKILTLFEDSASKKHLCAEEIRQQLIQQGEKVSFSTIYRTLHVMIEMGLYKKSARLKADGITNSVIHSQKRIIIWSVCSAERFRNLMTIKWSLQPKKKPKIEVFYYQTVNLQYLELVPSVKWDELSF